jgi:hypothetical protein
MLFGGDILGPSTKSGELPFVEFVIIVLISLVWFALRMPETLPIEKRIPFSLQQIVNASIAIIKMPVSLGNTIAAGLRQIPNHDRQNPYFPQTRTSL